MTFGEMTPEQRAENLEKARAARQAKAEFAKLEYRMDFLDDTHWVILASRYNVKLPAFAAPPRFRKLKSFAHLLGDNEGKLIDILFEGKGTQKEIDRINLLLPQGQRCNLRAYCGWMLEAWDELKTKEKMNER